MVKFYIEMLFVPNLNRLRHPYCDKLPHLLLLFCKGKHTIKNHDNEDIVYKPI